MNSSNQSSPAMEYVKYLNHGYDITIVLFHATTIFFTAHVIYCSKLVEKSTKLDRISNSFFIFLAGRGFGALLATPYQVYLTVFWSAEGGRNYEPYAHLWLGLPMLIHACLSTLSALLLTLERCLALTFPVFYKFRIAKWYPWFTFTCYILYSIFVTFNVLKEIPLDVEKVLNCQLILCVLIKYRALMPQNAKFGIAGLNILGSCYLLHAIKRNNNNTSEKLKNDVVKFTITMEIFLDVIPTFAALIFYLITGFLPAIYIGQLLGSFYFLNVAVCSVYYWWRLARRSNVFWIKSCRIKQVSPTTTTT